MNPYKECIPDTKLLDLVMEFERLSHVKRCSTMRIIKNRSVAEHSYMVAIISLVIADMEGKSFDREKLLMKALIHDCEEGISGDSPYTFKNNSKEMKAMFVTESEKKMEKIFGQSKLAKDFINCWANAKNSDYEGLIVKYADMMEFLVCCNIEAHMGNRLIRREVENAVEYLYKCPLKSVINLTNKLIQEIYSAFK
jgi:5'-deoxynucleotidase YfbR-like HD superfamily hydrolase